MNTPALRTDIVDVYVFTAGPARAGDARFLQMRRAKGALTGTWQPVMGHIQPGQSTVQTALRELDEETGYAPAPGRGLLTLWQLESVNTYYLASHDSIVMSPCFAALVDRHVAPKLNDEHDDFRWVPYDQADRCFLWPGQRVAVAQILRDILPAVTGGGSDVADLLRIDLGGA